MTKKSSTRPRARANALRVERIFDASAKKLWAYWTEPEKYAKWLNPAPGMDLVIHEFDVRPGGRVRFDMPQPDGNKKPQEGVFHTLTPYREIVTGAPDKSFLITVRFTSVGRKTRMTVTVAGVPPEYREGARKGWNAGFDKLAGVLDEAATEDRAIATTRVFDAPRDVVWKMWTEADEIARWWGPDGFTNSIESMNVRPGGVWKFVMHGPDGRDYENEIVYVEIAKPERLVYDHGPSPRFRTTVTFVDLGEKTKLTMRAVFATPAIRDKAAKEYGAVEGGKQTLGRLAEHLAKRAGRVPPTKDLVITRVFDAPRRAVWEAWTVPERVMEWWGPEGYTSPSCTIDLRVGGRYLFCMRSPEGKDIWSTGVYREIVHRERIVCTDCFADEKGNVVPATYYGMTEDIPLEMLVTVTLEDVGGKTKMTLRHAGLPAGEHVRSAGVGWNGSFDKLERILTSSGRGGSA